MRERVDICKISADDILFSAPAMAQCQDETDDSSEQSIS